MIQFDPMNMASRCELSRVSSSIQAYLYVTKTLDPVSSPF